MKQLFLIIVVLITPLTAIAANDTWSYNSDINGFTGEVRENIGVAIVDNDVINTNTFTLSCSNSNENISDVFFRLNQRYVPIKTNTRLHVLVDNKSKFTLNLESDSENNDWLGHLNQSEIKLFKNGKNVQMLLERDYPLKNLKLTMTLKDFNGAYDRNKYCLQ